VPGKFHENGPLKRLVSDAYIYILLLSGTVDVKRHPFLLMEPTEIPGSLLSLEELELKSVNIAEKDVVAYSAGPITNEMGRCLQPSRHWTLKNGEVCSKLMKSQWQNEFKQHFVRLGTET